MNNASCQVLVVSGWLEREGSCSKLVFMLGPALWHLLLTEKYTAFKIYAVIDINNRDLQV